MFPLTPQISPVTPPEKYSLSNGRTLYAFPSESTGLVKLDLLCEAGTAYQQHKLTAVAANNLYTTACCRLDARQLAEFIDYRGILVDSNTDALRAATTFYTLSRHIDDLIPIVEELVRQPAFPEEDFEVYRNKRRQEILAFRQKSADVARRLFYETLFGSSHPLGRYADPEDADRLRLDDVKAFYEKYHRVGDMDIVVAGQVNDHLIAALDKAFGHDTPSADSKHLSLHSPSLPLAPAHSHIEQSIPTSVQASFRVGRVLPLAWDSMDYAKFMILNTLLGGYFGSRLMSNLREDKGYTYGIYSRTQLFRGLTLFFITADVAEGAIDAAEKEVLYELQRLIDEPVSDDELNLVKVVLAGDFLRSVDGIFERSARFCDMLGTDIDERLTDNLRQAIANTTPQEIQQLAARYLRNDQLIFCRAGAL